MRYRARDLATGDISHVARSLGDMPQTTWSQQPGRDMRQNNLTSQSRLLLTTAPYMPDQLDQMGNLNALFDGLTGAMVGFMDEGDLNLLNEDTLGYIEDLGGPQMTRNQIQAFTGTPTQTIDTGQVIVGGNIGDVVTREEWGARHADGSGDRPMPFTGYVLHHSAGAQVGANASITDESNQMRSLESTGQQRFGNGISYPWVVFQSGRVYQGLSPHRVGAHTRGLNVTHSAICMPGNHEIQPVTGAQMQGIARVMVSEKRLGLTQNARILFGHRGAPGASTTCPGRYGMDVIDEINAIAARSER